MSGQFASPGLVRTRRAPLGCLRATLGMAAMVVGVSTTAQAEGWGFFGGGFFSGSPPKVGERPYDRPVQRHHPRMVRQRDPKEPDAPVSTHQISPTASHFVIVLGDSLGQRLANGLDEALMDRPDVAVVHKARDSTGLVRADFYDWPKAVTDLLAASDTRIDVAVMMIGSNDRQSLSDNGHAYAPQSDEWTALYTRRATALAEAFKKKNIPLIWVGVPIVRSDAFAKSMAALNDIYRTVANTTGAIYVDTWEAFSDGQGNFSAVGPDINGQIVRLRSQDGIYFTKAGDRKLANFVETAIRRALDSKVDTPVIVHAMPETSKPEEARKVAPKPDIGPVILLTAMPVAENGKLATPSAYRNGERSAATPIAKEPQAAPPGRTDDMSWPKP